MSQDNDTHAGTEGDLHTNNGTDMSQETNYSNDMSQEITNNATTMSQEIVTYGVQHLLDTAVTNRAAE
jgi:hypothetical protein